MVTALLNLFRRPDRSANIRRIWDRARDCPVPGDPGPPDPALNGQDDDWYLYFEVNLPAPKRYKAWLAENIRERQIIPYVLDAAYTRTGDRIRAGLEGSTHVDAMVLNRATGAAILVEAKVLSDVSYQISFDTMRNQVARNIDVMLEANPELMEPLCQRDPAQSRFILLTPRMFKQQPSSRLYGWLMREYCSSDRGSAALARDLPHRHGDELAGLPPRLGWLTWEDIEETATGSCPWLAPRASA